MLRKNLILFSVFALTLGLFAGTVFAARGVQVTLSPTKDAFNSDESVLIKVTITNPNKGSVRILRWSTPVDGVEDNLFSVLVNGKSAEYIGRDYKRPAPTDKDFLILRGGETIESTVDLAGFYDLEQTGYYQVSYKVERESQFASEIDTLTSDPVEIWISGRETKVATPSPVDSVAGSTGFSGCTSTRQSSLLTARDNAANYSSGAYNYMLAGFAGPRYTTWFGSYTAARYSTVTDHFSSILGAMNNASVTFNCSCTSSAYAYVYSTQPYTIYLCNAFWNAPNTGTDSKAGTLVHEMSHFNVVASTNDNAYGQSACMTLARKKPARAVDNADSHEYFAENTPAQN